MAQKIVIPKGTINPNETTVIEIPQDLQGSSVVIAKSKEHDSSFNLRQSFLDGRDVEFSLTDARDRARKKFPNLYDGTEEARKYMPYNVQPEDRTPPNLQCPYDSQLMGNASWGSSPRNQLQRTPIKRAHAPLLTMPYPTDFSPKYRSSPFNRETWTHKDYGWNPEDFVAPINRKRPELPHYDPAFLGVPRKLDFNFSESGLDSGDDKPQLEGASQIGDSGFSTATHEKMKALDQTEYVEQWQILADLRMYQHTRRKLIYDICNMGTGSVTSKSKMNRIMAPIKSVFGKKGKYNVNP